MHARAGCSENASRILPVLHVLLDELRERRVVPLLAERALEVARHDDPDLSRSQSPRIAPRSARSLMLSRSDGDGAACRSPRRDAGGVLVDLASRRRRVGARSMRRRATRRARMRRKVCGMRRWERSAEWPAVRIKVTRRRRVAHKPLRTTSPAFTSRARVGHMSCTPGGEPDSRSRERSITFRITTTWARRWAGTRRAGRSCCSSLLVGLAGLTILVERFYVIVFRSKNNGRVFIERIIQLVRAGKIDDAIKQCAARAPRCPTSVSSFCAAGAATRPICKTSPTAASLVSAAKADAAAAVPADAGRCRHSARRARDRCTAFAMRAPSRRRRGSRVRLSARFAEALTPTTFGLAVGDRADTWTRISRKSIRVDHRTDPRVLGAADQRADRPARTFGLAIAEATSAPWRFARAFA